MKGGENMKEKNITAKRDGKECGTSTIQWPENLKEAIELDGKDMAFEFYAKGKLLHERAKLYPSKGAKTVRRDEIYNKLIKNGLPEEAAIEISGYNPAEEGGATQAA